MIPVNFSWSEAFTVLKPLALFIVGVVIYSIFVFKFYRFLAKKDIFELDFKQYNTFKHAAIKKFFDGILYILKYLIVFPVLTFFWFAVMSVLLGFLSKSGSVTTILLIAMALVGSVRVTAYYNEDLSKDLAKMLPFALLGVFLIDISFFSFVESLALILDFPNHLQTMFYYLVFIIALEFILRLLNGTRNKIQHVK